MLDFSLQGRRALVCGSTQGIGKASAHALAQLEAEVTLLARDASRLAAVASELPASGGRRHDFIVADSSQPEALAQAVQARLDSARPYHVLVNNTGGPPGGPIAEAAPEAFLAAFQAHLICNQRLVQLLLPGFKAAGYGRVINIISTSVKAPIPGLGLSNTVRGAVASWAKTLAWELGPLGITVNNVLPGFTDTARLRSLFESKAAKTGSTYEQVLAEALASIPAGRLGRAEEIAAAVAFLASPAASYVNGINLPADGGRTPSL